MARKTVPNLEPEPIDSAEELLPMTASQEEESAAAECVFNALEEDAGVRLDQFLVARIPDVSRVRVQQLIEEGKVLVNESTSKPSLKLKGTEQIEITGTVQAPPLKAFPEDIPLDIIFEDRELAVVNKPA